MVVRIVARKERAISHRRSVVPCAAAYCVRATLIPRPDSGVEDHVRLVALCGAEVVRMGLPSLETSHVYLHVVDNATGSVVRRESLYLVLIRLVQNMRVRFSLLVQVESVFQCRGYGAGFSLPCQVLPSVSHVQMVYMERTSHVSFFVHVVTRNNR